MSDIPRTAPGRTLNDEDRRRIVELAISRRPDLHLEALHSMLLELGVDVDTNTLVTDLDALGYEVEAPPDHDATTLRSAEVDGSSDAGPTTVRGAAENEVEAAPSKVPSTSVPRTGEAGVRAARSDGTIDGDGDEMAPMGRPTLVVGAVVVLAIAFVVAALFARSDDDERSDGGRLSTSTADGGSLSTSTSEADALPISGSTASTEPLVVAPVGPGADEALADGVDGASDFEDPVRDGLGAAPDGSVMEVLSGRWAVRDGEAVLQAVEDGDKAGVAIFDPGLTDLRAQVELTEVTTSHGIIFWASDAQNYWAFVAAPLFSTFVLAEVRDGERRLIRNSGLTTFEDGGAVVGIHVTGGRFEALVNGAVVFYHEIDAAPPGQGIGIGSLPNEGGERQPPVAGGTFDDLVYKADA